jgi:hypothetical protein
MAHQINDNLLRAWVRGAISKECPQQPRKTMETPPRIVPLQVALPEPTPVVRIHIQQGSTQIHMKWPLANVSQCSDWLRGFLR